MVGYVHSIESFGTVDGPGVRLVVFMQGCPMRCQYCHNPDTWAVPGTPGASQASAMTVSQILDQYEASKSYYRQGGITVTGGEPLLQMEFVTELFEEAHKRGIHTCVDTSGITFHQNHPDNVAQMDRLMKVTDLVMLDIKHIDPEEHRKLCKQPNDGILAFARYLSVKGVPVWIRHVVVPGITQNDAYLYQLGRFIGTLSNVKALDVLPYHDMGKVKYQNLNMEYPLKDTPPLSKEDAVAAKRMILTGIRDERSVIK